MILYIKRQIYEFQTIQTWTVNVQTTGYNKVLLDSKFTVLRGYMILILTPETSAKLFSIESENIVTNDIYVDLSGGRLVSSLPIVGESYNKHHYFKCMIVESYLFETSSFSHKYDRAKGYNVYLKNGPTYIDIYNKYLFLYWEESN